MSSACAYAWLGGDLRTGEVGFDHLSLKNDNSGTSFAEIKAAITKSDIPIRNYLNEMRVSDKLHTLAFENSSKMMAWAGLLNYPSTR